MRAGEVRGIVRVPADFSRQLALGQAQHAVAAEWRGHQYGGDDRDAMCPARLASGAKRQADRAGSRRPAAPDASSSSRACGSTKRRAARGIWCRASSCWCLTLIGAFLTSLLIAREWERGTLEVAVRHAGAAARAGARQAVAVSSSSARSIWSCACWRRNSCSRCRFEARWSRSSLVSLLYLVVSLSLGLFISGVTRNQFQASQMALLASFMPALMLSGLHLRSPEHAGW